MYFSTRMVSSPKDFFASDRAWARCPGPVLVVLDLDHALAAAAGGRLDHDGERDLLVLHPLPDLLRVGDVADAGDDRHVGLVRQQLGLDLVSHQVDDLRGRADPE